MLLSPVPAAATEEATYTLVRKSGPIEIRDYAPQVLAEVEVKAEFADAGNRAFNSLFRYIAGDNAANQEIPMTAPVGQRPVAAKTAAEPKSAATPSEPDTYAVSFMMPANMTLTNTPKPDNSRVTLRQVPARRIAAIRYSGSWNPTTYARNLERLQKFLTDEKLKPTGPAEWARYNGPMTPSLFRRNEILIPIQ